MRMFCCNGIHKMGLALRIFRLFIQCWAHSSLFRGFATSTIRLVVLFRSPSRYMVVVDIWLHIFAEFTFLDFILFSDLVVGEKYCCINEALLKRGFREIFFISQSANCSESLIIFFQLKLARYTSSFLNAIQSMRHFPFVIQSFRVDIT